MINSIRNSFSSPILAVPLGIGGLIQSLIDWTTPLLQYIILVGTLIIVLNSCCKILFKKKK